MIIINILPNFLVDNQAQEVGEKLDTDELGALWIELAVGPEVVELADGAKADLQALFIHGAGKTFQNNSNKQVQENERDDEHETDEVDVGE